MNKSEEFKRPVHEMNHEANAKRKKRFMPTI